MIALENLAADVRQHILDQDSELARRIAVPHPRGGIIDVSAPLPPHMLQSWNLLGFDATRYDPIIDAPEEE